MLPVLGPQATVHGLEAVEPLALARRPQQSVTVRLVLHQCGAVHQGLRRVPDDVGHRLLWVNPEQMLEDGKEWDLLGRVLHPVVHGVEHVKVRGEVHIMMRSLPGLVALLLLIKYVKLDFKVWVLASGLNVTEYLK